MELVRQSFPARPALSTAISRAILLRVARGELPETTRVHRPGASVAFGRQDVASPSYRAAVRAAREGGFEAIERLAGGRAAVFHEQTIAISHAVPDRDPPARTFARFEEMSEIIAKTLRGLGIDARTGEVPREYCPGAYSVNARGRNKLAGVGQRIISGGAHVGGVIVVSESERVRNILLPVYAALGLDWDPGTVGSIEDELGAVEYEAVVDALIEHLAGRYSLSERALDHATVGLAEALEPEHLSPFSENADPAAGQGAAG